MMKLNFLISKISSENLKNSFCVNYALLHSWNYLNHKNVLLETYLDEKYLSFVLSCCSKKVIESSDHDSWIVVIPDHRECFPASRRPVREHRSVVARHDVVHEVPCRGGVDVFLARVGAEHHVEDVLTLVVPPLA